MPDLLFGVQQKMYPGIALTMTKNRHHLSKNRTFSSMTKYYLLWERLFFTTKSRLKIGYICKTHYCKPRNSFAAYRYHPTRATALALLLPLSRYSTLLLGEVQCQEHKQQHQTIDHCFSSLANQKQQHKYKALSRYWQQLKKCVRMLKRALKLGSTLIPILLLYPLHQMFSLLRYLRGSDLNQREESPVLDWWIKLCMWCVERNGAALVKLMQWASSRPDMFGEAFCARFSQLQDSTTPHSWEHTKSIMEEAYGSDWEQRIQLSEILGSGCIGQVYKGKATDCNGIQQNVAVKVIHPNVRDPIDADLELLHFLVSVLYNLPFGMGSNFKWWNLEGALEEFSHLLKVQLDFRKEAENLERFNANFKNDPHVVFPKSVKGFNAHPDVLVETYLEGMSISKFIQEHGQNKALLHKMCQIGVETVCQMIFYHNFVHADLHPGNILASLSDDGVPKFILLDVGMITEFKDEDYDNLIDILASFIRRNGRRAAELMIQDSEKKLSGIQVSEQAVINREKFISKIQYLTDTDRDISFFENIGGYILYICAAAATHHVRLNEAFASMALAIKVQEGVAISLDPLCHVWETANPIIVRAETRRRFNRMIRHVFDEISNFNVRNILQENSINAKVSK